MSANLNPHNPQRFREIHGIRLAPGSAVANLIIERLIQDPVSLEATRFWYNTTDKKFKLANVDEAGAIVIQEFTSAQDLANALEALKADLASVVSGAIVIQEFTFAADLVAAIAALKALLASQDVGKGTDLIGFAGIKNGEEVVAAKGTLTNLISDIYTKIDGAANNSGTLGDDLSSTEAGKGSGLIGFSGSTKSDGAGGTVVSVPAGTVETAIKAVDAKVDVLEQTVGDGRFLGTATLTDQSVESNVTFKKDIIINGDIIHNGENLIAQGTTVELGDSVLLLNRNLAVDATPSVDVGLQANRGKNGTNDLIIWKESEKQLKGIKVVTTEVGGVETEVVTLERITLSSDLSTAVSGLNTTINNVKSELEGDIDVVADSVADLSGELNTYKSDVLSSASNKGAALVGYANSDVLVAAPVVGADVVTREHVILNGKATVKDTLDVLVNAIEKDGNDLKEFEADLAGTDGISLVGGGEIGFIQSKEEMYKLTAGSLADALALAYSKINELALKAANKTIAITSSAKLTHTLIHNLGSTDLAIDLWIKDGAVWMNHSANMVIVDENTLVVNLSSAAEIKVIITKVEAYTRMVGTTLQA